MGTEQTLQLAVNSHEWLWVGGATLAMMLLGILLLGIPGAIFLQAGRALLKIDPQNRLGAEVWPLAIVATLVTPLGLPLGYLIARATLRDSMPARVALTLTVYVLLGFVFSSWLYIHAQNRAAKSTMHPERAPYRWPYGA